MYCTHILTQTGNCALKRYRITESLGREETSGGLWSYFLPKAGWDTNPDQVVQGFIWLGLENIQGVAIFTVIFFSSYPLSSSPFFKSRPPPLVSLPHATAGGLAPFLCWPPCRYRGLLLGASAAISSPGWTSPAPSSSPHSKSGPSGIKLLLGIPVLARNGSAFALLVGYFF